MKLVLIEGPGKRESIKKYLGAGYDVFATKGHVRDLPKNKFAIDLEHNFDPAYEIIPDKVPIVNELKQKAEKAEAIYLATDPDREGEAIAWHLARILNLSPDAQVRTAFNEISKNAIQESISHPTPINQNLVKAQLARRLVDRIMGYKLSPLLSKKIRNKLSAGRVQSVVLKLIVDREKAIRDFVKTEYWTIQDILCKKGDKLNFKSDLALFQNKKIEIPNEETAKKVESDLRANPVVVKSIKRSVVQSKAPAPYTTSSLQQDAINKMKFTLSSYTRTAQSLYEGVEIQGEGKVALVTYIRTDSTRVSPDAQKRAKEYILENYGEKFAPAKYNTFATKKNVQDAHEAIRPISLKYTPEYLQGKIDNQYLKLYTLIFNRFVASQMSNAQYDSLQVEFSCGDYTLKSSGKAIIFEGFTKVYKPVDEEKSGINIPNLVEGEEVDLIDITKEQKFTKPPVRYTESTIVKEMEDKGIGRPATYANTVMTIVNRAYVIKDAKNLVPTELGFQVTEYLEEYFKNLMNVKFTADMEEKLDDIEFNKRKWREVVKEFYDDFSVQLNNAYLTSKSMKQEAEHSGIMCSKCGGEMVYREGKFGKFLACSNYPSCKNTQNLDNEVPDDLGLCPKCQKPLAMKRSKKGKIFYGCTGYPECDFASWDEPLKELCPKCGKQLYKHKTAKGEEIFCNDKDCNYIKPKE